MKFLIFLLAMTLSTASYTQKNFEEDTFPTSSGDLNITFIGHGTLMFQWDGKVIHVDPVMREADYSQMPKADLILVTHEHPDHLDTNALRKILKDNTKVVMTQACYDMLEDPGSMDIKVMANGDEWNFDSVDIKTIPAYNMVHKRPNGGFYHPKGRGNGYILDFGGERVLVAGDTENIPEIKALKDIDIAFLPMNLPYTMTPEMVADAAKAFKPDILYPYHYGSTDTGELIKLMNGVDGVQVRVRQLQ